ncbi:baseplate J/gp47 family protein [Paenibacillus whitsoniae]|uniref:Baseplate J/gp47 family protein n=2 Tax=Paenibacillus whitsoniae TaxID=2496558 RepID=A0A430J7M4_9BACL|nr:baseplate J/gp47 family protein [Paenibacillus whitsoniae]
MLARIAPGISKQEGTFTFDVSSAFTTELAIAYTQLERVLRMGFAQTSSGRYLDQRADEHGVTRKPATKAVGQVAVTGTTGAPVAIGSVFATPNGTRFVTTAAATISSGTATVAIEAETAGAAGNVASGTITVIPVSIGGVSAVTNASVTTGGTDVETDASLLTRLLDRVRNQATSGNAAHYKQWATEVSGVGDAKVTPLWDGPGTVKVWLLDPDKRAPAAGVVTAAADHINSVQPIGATVTVVAAPEVAIDVSVDVTLSSGTLVSAQADILAGLTAYLKELAFVDPIVRYVRIANIVLEAAGVQDYTALTVNGGTANVTISDGSVAVPGTVTAT